MDIRVDTNGKRERERVGEMGIVERACKHEHEKNRGVQREAVKNRGNRLVTLSYRYLELTSLYLSHINNVKCKRIYCATRQITSKYIFVKGREKTVYQNNLIFTS